MWDPEEKRKGKRRVVRTCLYGRCFLWSYHWLVDRKIWSYHCFYVAFLRPLIHIIPLFPLIIFLHYINKPILPNFELNFLNLFGLIVESFNFRGRRHIMPPEFQKYRKVLENMRKEMNCSQFDISNLGYLSLK